jgi:glycosyltransferase involved in cell wall biosynthesis
VLTPPERCLLIGDEASCDVIRAKFARLPSLHVVVVALAAPEHLLWGPLFQELRQLAGPSVTFHGGASDETVVELMEGCSALCVVAEEDFGIAAVEAQAAGKPVIAYGRGGSLETIDEGVTGVFFRKRTEDSVIAAFGACERLDFSPERTAERGALLPGRLSCATGGRARGGAGAAGGGSSKWAQRRVSGSLCQPGLTP